MNGPDLITKREAATLLGVHPSTVNRMITDGRLAPARMIGGTQRPAFYLFNRTDVETLANRRKAS